MKMSTLSIIAVGIFICFATVSYYNTQTEAGVATVKRQYRAYMQNACESAVNSVDFTKQTVFGATADRQKAVKTFFSTLAGSLNREGVYADELLRYIPVIILLDYDGFYAWHGEQSDIPITEFVSWSESVGKYVVRYYLDEYVKVTDTAAGRIYYGERDEVYNLVNDVLLGYLHDEEEFEFRKNHAITSAVKKTIQYYINNNRLNEFNIGYDVELAKLDSEDWGRLIKAPTILAFLQGKQLKEINSNIVLNIYSFSGTEITGSYHYFIDEANKYHCLEELLDNDKVVSISGNYYYDGVIIEKLYNSMEECAKLGAYPGFGNE